MNKKGQLEMADLAGFLLIFIAVLVFGYVFIFLSPKSRIETYSEDVDNLAKQELINYLNYGEDGKNMADLIVLAVEQKNLKSIEKKTKELLEGTYYKLLIYQNGEVLSEMDTIPYSKKGTEGPFATMFLEDFYGTNIMIKLSWVKWFTG